MAKKKKARLNGTEALAQAFAAVDHQPLLDLLGVDISTETLQLALTHRSFAHENGMLPHNERLEFLGDSVLGLSVAAQLYKQYPNRPESDISRMRSSIVSRYGLSDVARAIGLGEHILLGRGEINTDGRDKDSILADTTEALLGAIYLEHGFEVAQKVVLRLFKTKIDRAQANSTFLDWKTALQEKAAELHFDAPEYTATATGPDHAQSFVCQAIIAGKMRGAGVGPNKKLAEQQAARIALHALEADEVSQRTVLPL